MQSVHILLLLSQASLQSTEQAPARIWLQKALHKYSQPEKAQDSQPQSSSSSAKQRGSSSNSGDSSSTDSGSVAVSKFQHGKRGNDLLAALLENGLMIATSFKMYVQALKLTYTNSQHKQSYSLSPIACLQIVT
jgi:hypothetical protein